MNISEKNIYAIQIYSVSSSSAERRIKTRECLRELVREKTLRRKTKRYTNTLAKNIYVHTYISMRLMLSSSSVK